MQADDHTENDAVNSPSEEQAAEQEAKLRKEIQELKTIIAHYEWSLGTQKFGDVAKALSRKSTEKPVVSRVPNVDTKLQKDLYRFGGFWCAKFAKDEYVFQFDAADGERKEKFAVQIFNRDGKGSLGKWVMPMSVDISDLVAEMPIDNLKNVSPFLRRCKYHIDCYLMRLQQFEALKEIVSQLKNCDLQCDLGYMRIQLELFGVQDKKEDVYIDIVVYLIYKSDTVRPCDIEVDSNNTKELKKDTVKDLKSCLKIFKFLKLEDAFEKMLSEDSERFSWTKEENCESPVALNTASSSDEEGFLIDTKQRSKTRGKRKQTVQEKGKQRKKQKKSSSRAEETVQTETEKTRTETQMSPQQKKAEKTKADASKSQEDTISQDITTPMKKPKVKLRQTKLNFLAAQSPQSDTADSEPIFTTKSNASKKKQAPVNVLTSTPLPKNMKTTSELIASTLEISNITTNQGTPRNTRKKTQNVPQETKKTTPAKKSTPKVSKHKKQLLRKLKAKSEVTKVASHMSKSLREKKPVSYTDMLQKKR